MTALLILDIQKLVADFGNHVDYALVADQRVTVLVDPVKNREAEAEQRYLGVAGSEFAVAVADDGIDRIGHQQRAQVPEVLVHVD